SFSSSTYSMQAISFLFSNVDNCQGPKPARIMPPFVTRIGSIGECFLRLAASLTYSIVLVQPTSARAGCNRNCSGRRNTGCPSCRTITVGFADGEIGVTIAGVYPRPLLSG